MTKALSMVRSALVVLVGVVGALLVLYTWRLPPFESTVQTTENAYVKGQVTIISSQLAGYVTDVAVQDFQYVEKGDLLVRVDSRMYEQKLRQAEAALAIQQSKLDNVDQDQRSAEARIKSSEAQLTGARAMLTAAEANARRAESLLQRGVSSQSAADQTRSALAQAQASVQQAEASLAVSRQDLQSILVGRVSLKAEIESARAAVRLAEIDVQNTRIVAPQNGRLGEIGVHLGQYVAAGSQLAALVPDRRWIIANFKENQLYGMKVDQPVSFTVDALRDVRMTGHIEAFSPAAGSEFSVLKPDNATGNFTKVAQRLPVRIAIDEMQPRKNDLAPGMSVVVSVDTAAAADPKIHGAAATTASTSDP